MVVARREGVEVVEGVNGNGILGSIETDGSSIAGNLALGDIVSGLGTKKETITTEDSVCGERGALDEI